MNLILNGNFSQWPDGTSFSVLAGTTSTAIFGNWSYVATGAQQPAVTVSRQAFGLNATIPEGKPKYFLRVNPATAPTTGTLTRAELQYLIEDDRILDSGYATVTFWAKASVAREIAVATYRDTTRISEVSIQLSTTWRKYAHTVRIPIISATYSGDNDFTVRFYLQSSTVDLTKGIQWKAGTVDFSQVAFEPSGLTEYDANNIVTAVGSGGSEFPDGITIGDGSGGTLVLPTTLGAGAWVSTFSGSTETVQHTAVNEPFTVLTDGATVTWALSATKPEQRGTLTLGGDRTLAFTGLVAGMSGTLIVKQPASGGPWDLTLPATSIVVGGALTLSTAANSVDILCWVNDGTNIIWTVGLAAA